MPVIVPASQFGATVTVETSHPSPTADCIHLTAEDLLAYPSARRGMTDSVEFYVLEDIVMDGRFHYMWRDESFVEEFLYGVSVPQSPPANAEILVEDNDPRPVVIGFNWTSTNYFHWLTQSAASIYSIVSWYGHSDLRIALPQLNQWQEDTLARLGFADLPRVLISPEKQFRFRKVVFANLLNGRTKVYDQFRAYANALLAADSPPPTPRKLLYVSRQDAQIRRIENEEALIRMMKQRGFLIVEAGTHSLAEQIRIFSEANVVVGPHGAGMTNTMFSREGTLVYEFMTRQYVNGCFARISQNLGRQHFVDFFDCPGSSQINGWTADLGRIERGVDSVLERLASFSS
jgi:hypothetical protein